MNRFPGSLGCQSRLDVGPVGHRSQVIVGSPAGLIPLCWLTMSRMSLGLISPLIDTGAVSFANRRTTRIDDAMSLKSSPTYEAFSSTEPLIPGGTVTP